MSRFEAFSEAGAAVAGEDATRAVEQFFLGGNAGQRVSPAQLADYLSLDADLVDDLVELGASTDVRLLQDRSQVRCPHCECRIDRRPLLDELEADGEATCPDCHNVIESPLKLRADARYALTDEAAAEAVAWQAEQAQRPTLRAVILCAIGDELRAIKRQLEIHGEVEAHQAEDRAVYLHGHFAGAGVEWEIFSAATDQTNAMAAGGAVGAVLSHAPQVAVFVGIAGSLKDDVALGDVVVADLVHDYEVGKETTDGYQERSLQHRSGFGLLQWARIVTLDDDWKDRTQIHDDALRTDPTVHVEPIAAGSKVVANKDSHTFRLIQDAAPRAVAVEMEGAGFLAGVNRFTETEGIVIRGISDEVEGKEGSDRTGWRHQAAANAAAFTLELLHRYEPHRMPDGG